MFVGEMFRDFVVGEMIGMELSVRGNEKPKQQKDSVFDLRENGCAYVSKYSMYAPYPDNSIDLGHGSIHFKNGRRDRWILGRIHFVLQIPLLK
jgi:hypothetical protein